MRQRSLHEYFTSDHLYAALTNRTPFLNLPYPLRQRVYIHASLIDPSVTYRNYLAQYQFCDILFEDVGYDMRRIPLDWER